MNNHFDGLFYLQMDIIMISYRKEIRFGERI